MEIRKAEFKTSAVKAAQYPKDDIPQIAMAGKSNVGKSSLINALTNRSRLAKVSSQPGKTRLINFFLVNDAFYLVDLPGYGFARVSKTEKESWGAMMNEYFEKAFQLKCIVFIVDIRHDPTAEDLQMAEWIRYYHVPVLVAASKSDKLGKTRIKPQVALIRKKLGFTGDVPVIPYSAFTRQGIEELLDQLDAFLTDQELDLQDNSINR